MRSLFPGGDGSVADLGMWYGSSNRVNMGLKTCAGVGESGSAQILIVSIRSHM